MYKQGIKYGLISGNICGIVMTSAYFTGLLNGYMVYITLSNIFFMFMGPFLGIYFARRLQNGEITFMNALKVGLSAAGTACLVFTSYTAFYYLVINPDFALKHLRDIEISLRQSGMVGDKLAEEMKGYKEMLTAPKEIQKFFLGDLLVYSVYAFIGAVILCKKD
jgi:hypothetical protein